MSNTKENRLETLPKTGRIGDRPYWVVNLSILTRAAHQIGAAVYLSAYLLEVIPRPPAIYVALVSFSGGLLFAFEWWRHRQLYREVAGVITLLKIAVLGAIYHEVLPPVGIVLFVFIVASIGAHAPKQIRHRLVY